MYGRTFGYGMMQGNAFFDRAPFAGGTLALWIVALLALGLAIAGFVIALRARASLKALREGNRSAAADPAGIGDGPNA